MGIWANLMAKLTGGTNPVSAVAGAVGSVADAVGAGEQLADHKQMLAAGEAEGTQNDEAETEKRVDSAAAALSDERLRADAAASNFRD